MATLLHPDEFVFVLGGAHSFKYVEDSPGVNKAVLTVGVNPRMTFADCPQTQAFSQAVVSVLENTLGKLQGTYLMSSCGIDFYGLSCKIVEFQNKELKNEQDALEYSPTGNHYSESHRRF